MPKKTPPTDARNDLPTRERVLIAASYLLSERGYHGTSTRAIAAAAGIQQSTLFHHFTNKAAILDALLEATFRTPREYAERIAALPGPAAPRLYRYELWDVGEILTAPITFTGLFMDQLRGTPEYERWYDTFAAWLGSLQTIVREGQAGGEFLDIPADVVGEMLHGVSTAAIRLHERTRQRTDPQTADQITRMTLRMLLRNPADLDEIAAAARRLEIDDPPLLAPAKNPRRGSAPPTADRPGAT